MRRQRSLRRRCANLLVSLNAVLLVLALVVAGPAPCQEAGSGPSGSATKMWASLRNQKPVLLGLLRLVNCAGVSTPCRTYIVRAFGYHLPGLNPTKLTVTDVDRHKVIFVDRSGYSFVYMLPLTIDGNLLATVWGSADSQGGVKVYALDGDDVRAVFANGSRFSPQFIAANEATPSPVVLLSRYTGGVTAIIPQETEIWQWDPPAEKFVLRATVPVDRRFDAVAKLEHEAKTK